MEFVVINDYKEVEETVNHVFQYMLTFIFLFYK